MKSTDDIKTDLENQNPRTALTEPIYDIDEVDIKRMGVSQTIVIGGLVNNEAQIKQLKEEGGKIQKKYKDWILKAVFDYFDVKIPNLIFDSQSPWLTLDKTQIFFRVVDVKSGTKFIVAADLNASKNITAYYVGLE